MRLDAGEDGVGAADDAGQIGCLSKNLFPAAGSLARPTTLAPLPPDSPVPAFVTAYSDLEFSMAVLSEIEWRFRRYTQREGWLDLSALGADLWAVDPSRILKLRKLRGISLFRNRLEALPDWLFDLTDLRCLIASENRLTELPDRFGGFSLEEVDLSDNRLGSIPASLLLPSLKSLRADGNRISSVGDEIGRCKALEELSLSRNQIVSVSAALGRCTKLEYLHLSRNCLQVLPAELQKLKRLREFSIDGNPSLDAAGDSLVYQGRLDPQKLLANLFPSAAVSAAASKGEKAVATDQRLAIPERAASFIKKWQRKAGFSIEEEAGSLHLQFQRLPDDLDSFVRSVYRICPDAVDQAFGCVAEAVADYRDRNLALPDDLRHLIEGVDLSVDSAGLLLLRRDLEQTKRLSLWWDD